VSELQHPEARSFEQVAAEYEQTRPSYPPEAVAWFAEKLGIGDESVVLDLGAGTGKLTRQLVGLAGKVIAVEPGPEMLAQLELAVPEAVALLGAAEAIPLADDSVDAVTCGQSFHWFRREEAVPEIHRVLRPGGGLGLIWNLRDPDDELQQELTLLLDPLVPPGRIALPSSSAAFVAEFGFRDVVRGAFSFDQELDAEGVVRRLATISFVAAASAGQKSELERRVRELVAARGGRVTVRYRTEVYVTFSVG
jgi:ubiquinone/menaquinone biosynthesis C-methylase UbiE